PRCKPTGLRSVDWVLAQDVHAVPPDVADCARAVLALRSADAERDLVAAAWDLEIVVGVRCQAGLNEAKAAAEFGSPLKFEEFFEAAELWVLTVLALRIKKHLVEHAVKNGFPLRGSKRYGLIFKISQKRRGGIGTTARRLVNIAAEYESLIG